MTSLLLNKHHSSTLFPSSPFFWKSSPLLFFKIWCEIHISKIPKILMQIYSFNESCCNLVERTRTREDDKLQQFMTPYLETGIIPSDFARLYIKYEHYNDQMTQFINRQAAMILLCLHTQKDDNTRAHSHTKLHGK